MEPSKEQLLAEIADLRQRLAEAEETLEALRIGAVDALVVSSPQGEQIFTLQGADQTYRRLVENINEGAATLTPTGDILYANGRLAAILNLHLERLIGSTLREYVAETDQQFFEALLSQGKKGSSAGEMTLRAANGRLVPVYLSLSSLELEDAPGAVSLLVADLTEQKRQEALLAEGRLSREILLQAQQAIAVCDREGRIIRASRALHDLLGENPLLLPFHQTIPLKLTSGRTFLLAPLFQGETLLNVAASFQRPDGQQLQLLVNAGPLVAQDGEITGFVATLTDISELVQARAQRQALLEKLQASEHELQTANEELQVQAEELQVQAEELQVANRELLAAKEALEENRRDLQYAQTIAHLGNWRLDVQQNLLTWSEENHRIFGIPPGTPLSYETFLTCVHPDDREDVDRHWHAALKGEPYDIEHRIVAGNTVKWVRELGELEFDAHGRLLGGFGTTQDITELKQKELEIKRLASFPQLNPNPVLEIDFSGTFTFVNSAAKTVLKKLGPGISCHHVLPQDWPEVQQITRQTATNAVVREIRIRDKVFVATIAFTEPFEVWRLYLSDITERKQAEEALQQALAKAEKGDRLLVALMAYVPEGITIADSSGRLEMVSRQGQELLGAPHAGKPIEEVVSAWAVYQPDGRTLVAFEDLPLVRAVQKGETIWNQELLQVNASGKKLPILCNAAPILDSKGSIVGGIAAWRDITERKQGEEALRRSHQRLDLLAETASRLLASEDPQAVVDTICLKVLAFLDCDVFFNFIRDDRADRLHLNAWAGIPAEEARRIEWLDYGVAVCGCAARDGCRIVADDIFNTPDPRTELVKSYGIQAYACQPLLSQGRVLGTLSFGTRKKARFNDDELALMQAVADQVAVAMERKFFLEALWQSKEQERMRALEMEAILEAVPAPIFLSRDPGGLSITGNPATYELLQLPPGSNLSLGIPAEERQHYTVRLNGRELRQEELPMQRALTGQRVQNLEYDLVLADGRIRHVSANAVPLLDDAGRPRGAVGAITDLTEIKIAQEALRRAHDELEERVRDRTAQLRFTVEQLQEEVTERLRAEAELVKQTEMVRDLYNQAPCGYQSLDSNGLIVMINDTELNWLGYSREEVVGRMNFADLLTPESLETFRQTYPLFLKQGRVQDVEYHLVGKDGRVLPVLLSATAVTDAAGNFIMSRATLYDITERRRVEQALRESEERLRFLANQLLDSQEQERKRLASELHDELGHALLTLKLSLGSIARKLLPEQENVKGLLLEQHEYINHVIEEVRRLYHDLSPGDLEDLGLTKALKNLIEEFSNHQPYISFHVDLPDLKEPLSIPAQTIVYRLVQEALTNIGKHAVPTRVSISGRADDGHLCLVIEDDGCGFDLSEVQRNPARGLGLAAMRERVYIVGGSLEIRTQKGQGTRLLFTIPYQKVLGRRRTTRETALCKAEPGED